MTTARHHLTGSRVELADAGCLFWARADVEWPGAPIGAASRLGSATHEAAQQAGEAAQDRVVDEEELADALRDATTARAGADGVLDLGPIAARWGLTESASAQLAELYETWRAWWIDWLPADARVRYEVPFAWDVATWRGRELPSTGPRDYSAARPSEVTCTLDAVVGCPDGRVVVVDLKTGRRRHPNAATHAQLATGALCVASVFGLDMVDVALAKILPGNVYVDEATLDAATLDARALSLSRYLDGLPSAQPVPGRHCSECYCPLLSTCEGPRALARSAPAAVASLPVSVETEEQAAAVLGAHRAMQAWLDGMKRSAREWAEKHGGRVRMPDGSTMRLVQQERRTVDATRAAPVLAARFGEDCGGLVRVKRSVSITEVERAASELGPKGRTKAATEGRRAAVASVVSDLERAGALRTTTFAQWETETPELPARKGEVL